MDACGIGRQRDLVAGAQIELADIARRKGPDRTGIDIEEGIAAEMFGGHHRSLPALPFAIDLEMLGPYPDGRSTPLQCGFPGNEIHLRRADEAGHEQIRRSFIELDRRAILLDLA